MGDIKKPRKKFSKPNHPWNKERILAEQELMKEYGLRRKKEIWKMNSLLSNFARQAKELISVDDEIKKNQLLNRLYSLGLLKQGARVEDVLSIDLKDLMNRRLQTLVFKKNLARSINQSRQLIVHEHISIGGKKITIPSYLVNVSEESQINFAPDSGLNNPDHPERYVEKETVPGKDVKEDKDKKIKPKKKAAGKKEPKKESKAKPKKGKVESEKKGAKEDKKEKASKTEPEEKKEPEKSKDNPKEEK